MIDRRDAHRVLLVTAVVLCSVTACMPVHGQTSIPRLTGRVMDHADILSDQTKQSLTDLLRAHEDSTGNQIVVLTVASLGGEEIESFGLRAARSFELGTAERDNGILVVVAPQERKVRIEVGYGLEGIVPDVVAARIIRNEIIPRFREGDFDSGVEAGTTALLDAVEGEYHADVGADIPPILVRLIFGLVFGFALLSGGFAALVAGRVGGRILLTFLSVFVFVMGFLVGGSAVAGTVAIVLYVSLFAFLSQRKGIIRLQERMSEAAKKGERVPLKVGPFSINVGGMRSGGSGGGFGGGGGGFSGGGGSFGGGGASGGW